VLKQICSMKEKSMVSRRGSLITLSIYKSMNLCGK
jgi:hypothetical protein